MFCSNCGSKIVAEARFCANCGNRNVSENPIDQEVNWQNKDPKSTTAKVSNMEVTVEAPAEEHVLYQGATGVVNDVGCLIRKEGDEGQSVSFMLIKEISEIQVQAQEFPKFYQTRYFGPPSIVLMICWAPFLFLLACFFWATFDVSIGAKLRELNKLVELVVFGVFFHSVIVGVALTESFFQKRVLLTFRHQGKKKKYCEYAWKFWGSDERLISLVDLAGALSSAVEESQRKFR